MRFLQSILISATLITLAVADCGNFTVSKRVYGDTTYTRAGDSTIRLSALVNCTSGASSLGGGNCNSTTCYLTTVPDILVLLNRTINITASDEVSNNLFDIARDDFQTPDRINFNASWAYETTGVSTCLDPDQAGYFGFTPIYRCVDGTVSQCKGDGFPADGTSLRLCNVGTLGLSHELADGVVGFVTTIGVPELPPPANATLPANQVNGANAGNKFASVLLPIAVLFTAIWM